MNINVLEKLGKRITINKVTIVLGIVFILSLVPIIYLSFFNYATGDDLWEGAVAHQVIVNGGGVIELITAIKEWFIVDYMGWEGNWSSIILWCLEPSIWGERVYIITAYIALAAICGCSWIFINHFVRTYVADSKWMVWLTFFGADIMMIQYVPNLKNAIFWYTGMINYMVPFGCFLLVMVWCDKFLSTGKKKYIVLMSITMLYMSGAGYPAIVLVFLGVCIEYFAHLFWGAKRIDNCRSKTLLLIIPIVLLIIGFVISAVSPGNATRGGDNYYFSFYRVLETVVTCFKYGGEYAFDYLLHARLWIIIYPIAACLIYEHIDVTKYKYSFPGLFTLVIVCLWCAGFAPEIYAMDGVSGGVPNTYYFTFVLCTFCLMTFWLGWIKKKMSEAKSKIGSEVIKSIVVIASILGIIVLAPHFYARTTLHDCVEYVTSGQLADYNKQMKERIAILEDDSIKDVVLPEINEFQGPFMHMPVTSDPNNYTNQCTARFYNKNSVISINRSEWENME